MVASGALSAFIRIRGYAGLFAGKDSKEAIAVYKKTGAPAA